jgi:hypothetical protein
MRTPFSVFTWAAGSGSLGNRESIYERKPFDAQETDYRSQEAFRRGA